MMWSASPFEKASQANIKTKPPMQDEVEERITTPQDDDVSEVYLLRELYSVPGNLDWFEDRV